MVSRIDFPSFVFIGGGASEPADVFRLGRTDAANGATVNTDGYDAPEESPVETLVAAQNRLIANCRISSMLVMNALETKFFGIRLNQSTCDWYSQ
jgi:hypothetical protein